MSGVAVPTYSRVARLATAGLVFLFCVYCLWAAARIGFSRLRSAHASNPVKYNFFDTNQFESADAAVRLAPSDPDARLIRAALLQAYDEIDAAVKEYEQAVALRPKDYVLWLELGLARDQAGNQEGAVMAFKEAVLLAPFYVKPRWHLGNIELRAGRMDEAFAEMRRAAASNPALLPQLIELAWAVYDADVPLIEQAVQPHTTAARLALARFIARHGKSAEAVRIFRAIENISEEDRSAFITELLSVKQFNLAFEAWAAGPQRGEQSFDGGFVNGGFEGRIILGNSGFGWQIARDLPTVRLSIDSAERHQGSSSLRLDWEGDPNPATRVLSQIIVVEPEARYRLRFSARSEKLESGGLPVIAVLDPHSDDYRELVTTKPLPQSTTPWQDYVLEFTTGKEQQAVLVTLRRQGCGGGGPCPIFGTLWLDGFSLEKI